jgi:hypothetical protein
MLRRAGLAGALCALALSWAGQALAENPFSDWAAIVVAGDFHASDGGPTEAFDNARRDISRELERIGFDRANMRQFSVRPTLYNDGPLKSEPKVIYDSLNELSRRTKAGCLIYFTSHGEPRGVIVDRQVLTPAILGRILDATCADRPTVVVMSACFSGVFVPALAHPNRMILTAARPDRTSFGCGQDNKYPYFDDCFLQSTPFAKDLPALASTVRSCVAAREIKEGMKPPSEPQIWIGAQLRPMLPLYRFPNGPPSPKGD